MTTLLSDATAAPRSPVQTSDSARVATFRDLVLSPDGGKLLFFCTSLNQAGDGRTSRLWLMDIARRTSAPLFSEPHADATARWSPDGRQIAFLREVEDVQQLHIVPVGGGSASAITAIDADVDDFLWSPDGKMIAFVSAVEAPDAPPELPAGVRIITRADHRASGIDGIQAPVAQVWLLELNSGGQQPPMQITHAASSVTLSFWSKDSKALWYTTNDTVEPYYGNASSSLHSVNLQGQATTPLRMLKLSEAGQALDNAPELRISPDGSQLAFTAGNPDAPADFAQDKLFVMDLATGRTVNVTAAYDREVGGDGFAWKDDGSLIAIACDNGNAILVEVEIDSGRVTPLWTGERAVTEFAIAGQSGRLVAVASDFTTLPEIYEVNSGLGTRVTHVNQHLEDALLLTRPEPIFYPGPGGETIHGWLQKPPHFDPAQEYPLVVWAHGGPYHYWNSGYHGDVQAIAAAGYLVMYVNPRGSVSYGQAFASALADSWPGLEFDDTMAGVDYLVKRAYVDGARLGMAGGSAGGILTDWAIGHTDRFKAAVSISSIADNGAYWFLGDEPDFDDTRREPWLDERDHALSPITHGRSITTPTLFMTGTEDFRTPAAAGAEMMFRLLKYLRVPTALVEFEGAGHVIRGNRDVRHQGLSMHYLIRWMDLHLQGKPAPEFDAPTRQRAKALTTNGKNQEVVARATACRNQRCAGSACLRTCQACW